MLKLKRYWPWKTVSSHLKSWKLQKLLSSSTLAANISVQHLQTLSALLFAGWCRPLCLLIISPVSTPPLKKCPWTHSITGGYMDLVNTSYWNRQFMINLVVFSMKWSYLQVIFSPPPSTFFFSRSNFRAITRLETLATQANQTLAWPSNTFW